MRNETSSRYEYWYAAHWVLGRTRPGKKGGQVLSSSATWVDPGSEILAKRHGRRVSRVWVRLKYGAVV